MVYKKIMAFCCCLWLSLFAVSQSPDSVIYDTIGAPQHFLYEAFQAAESGKCILLYSALKNNQLDLFADVPDSLINLSETLQGSLERMRRQLPIDSLHISADSISLIETKLAAVKQILRRNYPHYYYIHFEMEVATIQDVQDDLLSEDQALIEYFYSNDLLYYFVVLKDRFAIFEVPPDSLFKQKVDRFRTLLQNPIKSSAAEFAISAYDLYDQLLKPAESLIQNKNLIICPEGLLSTIPFGALTMNLSDTSNFSELRYLIKSRSVVYINSATISLINKKRFEHKPPVSAEYVAFAPTFENIESIDKNIEIDDTARNYLSTLQWSVEEVESLGKYFSGKTYKGVEAKKSAFDSQSQDSRILHIASHGLLDDANPGLSKIAFYQDPQDASSDNYLHVYELYNKPMNVELAVLSACNTGYGSVSNGEGVLGLARGFFIAGCHSVMMSLWSANDQSTAEIMDSFYQFLSKGMDKDLALQQSKLRYLTIQDGIKAHPYFWSQMIINGDSTPLIVKQKNRLWIWIAAIALVFIVYIQKRSHV